MRNLSPNLSKLTKASFTAWLVFLALPNVLGQPGATLVRRVTPPSWQAADFQWIRDVQPHNKIDDLIDNSTNQLFDVVVNYKSCPTASDIALLTNHLEMELTYLTTVSATGLTKVEISQIAAQTNVAFIEQELGFSPVLTISVPTICVTPGSASCAGSVRPGLGFDGTGVNIAIIDSGVDIMHPAFAGAGRVVATYNAIDHSANVHDDFGHGTHVASIALGQATVNEGEGVAPHAGLIAVKVYDALQSATCAPAVWSQMALGLKTVYDNRTAWNVGVINISMLQVDATCQTAPAQGNEAFNELVNLAESMGIVVVAAAGNDGPCNMGLGSPAVASRAITVAASQTQGMTARNNDTIACFSSRGQWPASPNPDLWKPDVAAPGIHLMPFSMNCMDCNPFLGMGIVAAKSNSGNQAIPMWGTSMSAPHVAGLAALIIQARQSIMNPINPASVKQVIIDTATMPNGMRQASWMSDSGWGHVNGYAAVSAVAMTDLTFPSYPPAVPWESPDISISPDPAIIGSMNTATVLIQNRGPNAASNVRVHFGVYVFSAATPTFENIGTVVVPYIPFPQMMPQPVTINWVPQAATLGHNCLRVEIGYGADSNFANNTAQRNIYAQNSPVHFMVQNTATEVASVINLVPTFGPNIGGSSNNWTYTLQPTNVVLAANDCPVPVSVELFPATNAVPGEQQALRVEAVANTLLGSVSLGGVTITAVATNAAATNTSLPVYKVLQYGAMPSQATAVANWLNIPTNGLVLTNGEMSFIDPTAFMAVPTLEVTDSMVTNKLLAATVNEYPAIPLRFEQLDFGALSNLTVLSSGTALSSAAAAFANANLIPQLGVPVVGHTTLNAYYTNDSDVVVSNSAYLDTQLNYQFGVGAGYPLVGPGAQVQVGFGTTGNVTRLLYSAPQLASAQSVQIISPSDASNRVVKLIDPGGWLKPVIVPRIVYYVPHWPWPPCLQCPPINVTNTVLPWYECGGTATVTNPITAEVSSVNLIPTLIPATDDAAFVPAGNLSASVLGGTQVVASVTVSGGMPPYTYQWAGSSADISLNTGASVMYTPKVRTLPPVLAIDYVPANSVVVSWADPSAGFTLESTMSLQPASWAPVTDPIAISNGVKTVTLALTLAQARFFRLHLTNSTLPSTEIVAVTVTDANGVSFQTSQTLSVQATPQVGGVSPQLVGTVDWGTENTLDPGICTPDGADWRSSMTPGGGAEGFLWTGNASWKLDFIEELNGLDHVGVDNADIVFYAGHGNPTVITFVGGPGSNPTTLFYNEATHVWGNNDQEWMCLLSGSVLQFDWNDLNVWQRWGPAFDGLHILTGFRTTASAASGFPRTFVRDLLGQGRPSTSIIAAWFDAALARENGPDGKGRAAAMGPIGPGGVCDIGDFYWGRGSVGPAIRSSDVRGWYYISQQ